MPTPVAWTRLRAPQSLMAPSAATVVQQTITSSPLYGKYAQPVDRESAYEMLTAKIAPSPAESPPSTQSPTPATPPPAPPEADLAERVLGSPAVRSFARSMAGTLGREITRGIFGTAKRR